MSPEPSTWDPAPTLRAAHRGIDERQVKLGCVQPGESAATFGDALRRLTDSATYLYVDGKRYWYSTQPTVTRLADDRAGQLSDDQVTDELVKRLREEARTRADFSKVHACVPGSDVPDEKEVRLVILSRNSHIPIRMATAPHAAKRHPSLNPAEHPHETTRTHSSFSPAMPTVSGSWSRRFASTWHGRASGTTE
ncbi:MAG UNVERIFIED_CONTAM: hypothetical protein LVR18_12145 [Planctomycetaceae bacterium]